MSPRAAAPGGSRRGARPVVAGIGLSHADRVVFPDCGTTKLDLARYYERHAAEILPHVAGRPLTLLRCPGAIGDDCYFMKHSKVWAPEALERVRIPEKTKLGEYLVASTPAALVALAQMDVIEIHTWSSRVGRLEQPDRLVFDLDPGPLVAWRDLVAAARLLRQVLRALGLESFVKTTGGIGLHVLVPLVPQHDIATCLAFARSIARALARADPRRYTIDFARVGREQKVLVDYLRNNRTNTAVAALSVRARTGAPISVPLDWDELGGRRGPPSYTLATIDRRLAGEGARVWDGYFASRQRLEAAALASAAEIEA